MVTISMTVSSRSQTQENKKVHKSLECFYSNSFHVRVCHPSCNPVCVLYLITTVHELFYERL